MNCCQCQGIENLFDKKVATKELRQYRKKGPDKTTRMLIEALEVEGVDRMTLLDIGGGIGAIQHELLAAGVESATSVEASPAYIEAAKEETERQGRADLISYHYGNFVDLATDIGPADIVTLDRVICCYDDMKTLVGLSAARANKLYGVVFPRDTWWTKIGFTLINFGMRIKGSSFRSFIHSTEAIDELVGDNGLERRFYRKTAIWQVVVYSH
jgi:2-polyprenyl-3-methyl-5-hydroxy-6-metoxy-1,4-benzoquinol methylase